MQGFFVYNRRLRRFAPVKVRNTESTEIPQRTQNFWHQSLCVLCFLCTLKALAPLSADLRHLCFLVDPRHVLPCTRVNPNNITLVDESRHLHFKAGLGNHLLGNAGGRITFDSNLSLHNL